MYSGLLPKGLTEDDLSPDDDEENVEEKEGEKLSCERENAASSSEEVQPTVNASDTGVEATCSLPGISQEMWQVSMSEENMLSNTLVFCKHGTTEQISTTQT